MGKTNATWHRANPMPKNPTLDQRIAWHIAHAQHCGCRAIDGKIRQEMERRGMMVPVFKAPAAARS
jgi:hypothetical protein